MSEREKQQVESKMQADAALLPVIDASHIHLLVCGGTIDNIDLDTGSRNTVSGVEAYLKSFVKPYFGLTRDLLFMKDSREVTDADRERLLEAIIASPFNRFLVTHGTFTMAETGRYLKRRLQSADGKLVILAGSMIPLGEPNSDAPFNLGFACAAATMYRENGVFIAFNGKIWDPDDVKKNIEDMRFEQT
jgi:L-asparaginase